MNITISIESTLKQVYALSALNSFLTQNADAAKPFLSSDNKQAMLPLLNEALSFVAVDLIPHIAILTPPNLLDDIIEIDLRCQSLPQGAVNILESALAMRMLQIIYAPIADTTARNYGDLGTAATRNFLTLVNSENAGSPLVSITPSLH